MNALSLGVPFVLVLAACSLPSSSDDAAPASEAAQTSRPGPVTIQFSSERDGFAGDVDSIVYSDQFRVRLERLPPGAEVVLGTSLYSPFAIGRGYTSEVTFVANSAGQVDTGTSAPIRGSYEGVDPDGLVWSSKAVALAEGLGPDRAAAFFTAKIGDATVASAALHRTYGAAGVAVERVTEDGLVAELFLPAGATDKIPVVAFGGSEGGIRGGEGYASRLASFGHPVLAVAYFGAAGVPAELTNVPLEYFAKAFAYLDRRPETRKGKAIVMGGSRGGELALLLGATFTNVVGVIADTPSSFRWASVSGTGAPAWTFGGTALPFVPSSGSWPERVTTPTGENAWVLRTMFEKDVAAATPAARENARIAVEKTRGPVLMFGGSDDAMWQACDFIDRAKAQLDESGHAAIHGDEGVCFPQAGHNVTSIGLPMTDSMWATLGAGQTYALGGSAGANARAGRARDAKVRAFLERVTR